MDTLNHDVIAAAPGGSYSRRAVSLLAKRRGLVVVGGAITAAAAITLGEGWLPLRDLLPLLYVVPCAVMMFMCMKGMNHGDQAAIVPEPERSGASTGADSRN